MTEQQPVRAFLTRNMAIARVPMSWVYVIVTICAFMLAAIIWAANAEIDERSQAQGRVISSQKTQIIQSAEPGVISKIFVRTGEQVKKNQQLVLLDDTTTTASAGEVEARVQALTAQVARLRLEAEGRVGDGYVCPVDLIDRVPEVCANEAGLLRVRQENLEQYKQVLQQRVEQRRLELAEAETNRNRLTESLRLAQDNLALLEPLATKNLVSQTEWISAQAEVNNTSGEHKANEQAIARLNAALREAELQVLQSDLQFRQEAQTDLTLRLAELAGAEEQLRGASDRVSRTDIRAPVDGIVNEIKVNTIGAFVNAGERLMDIVPVDDTLLIEARLKPSDVAFVIPGQKALIKFTAYDFSIFGGLDGEVTNVSADSIVDPETRETYYLVLIRTDSSGLVYRGEELRILPGMVASVEIITGKKTVLQYLLKPVNKAREDALRER